MPDRKEHLISTRQIRMAVALGTVGMITTIVVLLLLGTSRPQGSLVPLDETQFQQHLADSTAALAGYEVDGERARIDIYRAIELVAERGVQDPGFYVAGAAPAGAPATGAPAAGAMGAADGAGTEGAAGAPGEGAATVAELPDGEALFNGNCSACHQASGQGIPGAFPPLAGHAPALYQADRDLPLEIITFGMQGAITVDGMAYNGLMPAHLHLTDAQLAAIANHVMTAWGNDAALPDFAPYGADDAAAVRAQELSMSQVLEARAAAGLD